MLYDKNTIGLKKKNVEHRTGEIRLSAFAQNRTPYGVNL
jgi:hypothetical protein